MRKQITEMNLRELYRYREQLTARLEADEEHLSDVLDYIKAKEAWNGAAR